MIRSLFLTLCAAMCIHWAHAEDGSRLWLPTESNGQPDQINLKHSSPTLDIAADELRQFWHGQPVDLILKRDKSLKADGFSIRHTDKGLTLSSPHETGLLYAAYHLLRMQAAGETVNDTVVNPTYSLRILNHWDNPDGTIERGYAGKSLWQSASTGQC